jgi:hypothetical protein
MGNGSELFRGDELRIDHAGNVLHFADSSQYYPRGPHEHATQRTTSAPSDRLISK